MRRSALPESSDHREREYDEFQQAPALAKMDGALSRPNMSRSRTNCPLKASPYSQDRTRDNPARDPRRLHEMHFHTFRNPGPPFGIRAESRKSRGPRIAHQRRAAVEFDSRERAPGCILGFESFVRRGVRYRESIPQNSEESWDCRRSTREPSRGLQAWGARRALDFGRRSHRGSSTWMAFYT